MKVKDGKECVRLKKNDEPGTEPSYSKLWRRRKSLLLSFTAASGFLGKRLSESRKFLLASQLWKQAVPSIACDVVLTFPPNASEYTIVWLLAALRSRVPELIVEVRHHKHSGVFGFYFTASYENLLHGAELMKLRKLLKAEFGGGIKEFLFAERDCFEDSEDQENFLSSQERQSIILSFANSLRAQKGEQLSFIKFHEGQPIIAKCISEGIISQMFPLHNSDDLAHLKKNWVKAFFSKQPLDDICNYFGVKIAIYFAWLGHYTQALTFPAFFGFVFWIGCYGRNQAVEDLCFVIFAFFNVFWATLYLESWKRRCAELAYHWGTLDSHSELLAEPRPLYTGSLQISPVTGRLEPTYPAWKRNLFRYCISLPVIVLCLLVVFLSIFLIFQLQHWWDRKISALGFPFWFTFFPKILLALVIGILDSIYYKVAFWLNEKENYRLEENYQNHLIVKLVLFQFVNSFSSLFYIAFYLQDMDLLKEQLAALLITRQVVGNIKESLVPFLTGTFKLAQMTAMPAAAPYNRSPAKDSQEKAEVREERARSEESNKEESGLSQAEIEAAMYKYDNTFEDYLEMFIQFGYVILFSSAFPMAAACAFLNNLIEIRSDAFKLCMIFQRLFGQRVENIGTWQNAMEIMGVIGVIVNCALIGMSGQVHRMFPDLSATGTIILIIALEHIILSLKFGIAYAIPDVPGWVATEMAKVEFHRRDAAKHVKRRKSMIPSPQSVLTPSPMDEFTLEQMVNPAANNSFEHKVYKDVVCQTSPLDSIDYTFLTSSFVHASISKSVDFENRIPEDSEIAHSSNQDYCDVAEPLVKPIRDKRHLPSLKSTRFKASSRSVELRSPTNERKKHVWFQSASSAIAKTGSKMLSLSPTLRRRNTAHRNVPELKSLDENEHPE